MVGSEPVFLGEREGRDLNREEGWRLAQQVGMDEATFDHRFDGTPGSLLVDADAPPPPAEPLPDGDRAGTAIHTVAREQLPADVPTNLPEVTSTFVGREAELIALKTLLDAGPLVTLTGPLGVGKTRLAVRAAKLHAGDYPDGVWYVDLASTRYEHQVADILARSVGSGRRAFAGLDRALADDLREQRALVILNGCDRVRQAAAELAFRLTNGRPPLRVLATSPAPLDVPWEHVLALQPLSTTEEAERLFFDRSGLGRRDSGLSPAERTTVEPLYTDLHGNAAALEIAGAQVRRSGVARSIDARRRRSGSGEASDVLRLAVLSSLHDVPEPDAAVFARLAAMPDWFTLAAARAVVGGDPVADEDVPDHLRALVDRALVLIDVRDVGGQRFRLLQSVREIAAEQLQARGEVESTSRRHAEHYLRLAEQSKGKLQGRSARRWLARLEAEQQHFRAALRWGVEHDRSVGLRLAAALWLPSLMRSNFSEARRWMDELVTRYRPQFGELSPEEVGALADVALGAGYLAYHQADYPDAARQLELFHELQQRAGTGPAHADDISLSGLIARRRCRFDEALALLTAAADVNRAERKLGRLADRLNTIGNVLRERRGDLAEARRLQEESLAIFARLGDLRGAAMVQCDLGYLHMDLVELEEARGLLEESLATRKRVKDAQGVAQSLNGLGQLERQAGATEAAIRHHEKAAERFQDMGDELRLAESFEALALALAVAGRAEEIPGYLQRSEEVRARLGAPRPPVLVDALQRILGAEDEPGRTGRFTRSAGDLPATTPSADTGETRRPAPDPDG